MSFKLSMGNAGASYAGFKAAVDRLNVDGDLKQVFYGDLSGPVDSDVNALVAIFHSNQFAVHCLLNESTPVAEATVLTDFPSAIEAMINGVFTA